MGNPRSSSKRPVAAAAPGGGNAALLVAGIVCLLVATIAAGLLAVQHIAGIGLPGCRPDGPCAQAAASFWGKIAVGGFVWPVSFLGLAFFDAALVGWVVTRGRLSPLLKNLARLGALASLFFLYIVWHEKLPCGYCITAHVANLLFWLIAEAAGAGRVRATQSLVAAVFAFASTSVLLGVGDAVVRSQSTQRAEQDRTQSVQEIIRKGQEPPPSPRPTPPPPNATATQPALGPPPTTAPTTTTTTPDAAAAPKALAGRYRWGPAEAPIRIVMFSAYQCPDCLRIESQIEQLMQRPNVAVWMRHFPFTSDCNKYIGRTTQPNGCWAARAAEAAGILYGDEGFWKMHKWLFQRRGVFQTTQELEDGLRQLGFDTTNFVATMQSEEPLNRIREDVEFAQELGLFFTPMIFVNGVELKGWHVPNALIRTVDEVLASNPPPLPPTVDRPPLAIDKYVADWRDGDEIRLPADATPRRMGPDDAKIQVVIYGDLQEPGSAEADILVRGLANARGDIRYTWRHYPFNQECNPNLQRSMFPQACRAAQAAEAAGFLGGADAYWGMQAWLAANRADISDGPLRAAAQALGLSADELVARMGASDVAAAIADDVASGKQFPSLRIGMPAGIHSIPTIFVNGRLAPRWKLGDRPILDLIVGEAGGP